MTILKNAANFRDMGGIKLPYGEVAKGLIYRSNHLCYLDEGDQVKINGLDVGHFIDFRSAEELEAFPPNLASYHDASVHSLAIRPGSPAAVAEAIANGEMSAAHMVEQMTLIYGRLINEQLPTYKQFFQLLLDAERPVVFNCAVGKDRTGVAAMLLLLSLGADWAAIEADYLVTQQRIDVEAELDRAFSLWGERLPAQAKRAWFAPIFQTNLAYLHEGKRALDQTYGDIDGYWQALDLGGDAREALRQKYCLIV